MHLNYLPISFNSEEFRGSIVPYEGKEQLQRLRRQYDASHFFYRHDDRVYCCPYRPDVPAIGAQTTFNLHAHFSLANSLARNALLHSFFRAGRIISSLHPVAFVLRSQNLASRRPDVFCVWPEYNFDVRPLASREAEFLNGLLIDFGTRRLIATNCAELSALGVDLTGIYVQLQHAEPGPYLNSAFARHLAGRITRVDSGIAFLDDSEVPTAPLDDCFVEPSMSNFERLGRVLLGPEYDHFRDTLQQRVYDVTGAENQYDRLLKMGTWLAQQSPLECSEGLSFSVSARLYEVPPGTGVGSYRVFRTPNCVLRPGGTITVPWPIDRHIDANGPFDTESFPEKQVRLAIICPEEYRGEVDQFLAQLKGGVNSRNDKQPFRQGFLRKYRLNACSFSFYCVKSGGQLAESYRDAALRALADGRHSAAIVVIKQADELLRGAKSPYYGSKAVLMSQGLTVQVVKIETVRQRSLAYTLNNVALALYAKIGGVPWVLSSAPGLVHEVIVGIGSANIGEARLGGRERVIGITTVFSGDGNYLLANSTQEVSSDLYLEALLGSLQDTVASLRRRYGWQPRDRVRFIFHQTFKKYREIEAEAVRQFVEALDEFEVEFAFVHVSTSHDWKLFDNSSIGAPFRSGRVKGKGVPGRGVYVPLGPHAALVTLTGPHQLKTELQGCPRPVLISVHPESSFRSLDYVAQQVFNLTFMSWRSFAPSTLPVSIAYSNWIVGLLGHLRPIANWNPDTLSTKLKEHRWFL